MTQLISNICGLVQRISDGIYDCNPFRSHAPFYNKYLNALLLSWNEIYVLHIKKKKHLVIKGEPKGKESSIRHVSQLANTQTTDER